MASSSDSLFLALLADAQRLEAMGVCACFSVDDAEYICQNHGERCAAYKEYDGHGCVLPLGHEGIHRGPTR